MRVLLPEETKKRLYLEFLDRFDRGEVCAEADWLECVFLSGLEKGLNIARKRHRLIPLWLARKRRARTKLALPGRAVDFILGVRTHR